MSNVMQEWSQRMTVKLGHEPSAPGWWPQTPGEVQADIDAGRMEHPADWVDWRPSHYHTGECWSGGCDWKPTLIGDHWE